MASWLRLLLRPTETLTSGTINPLEAVHQSYEHNKWPFIGRKILIFPAVCQGRRPEHCAPNGGQDGGKMTWISRPGAVRSKGLKQSYWGNGLWLPGLSAAICHRP
jgi:hypothetical protein